MFKQTAQYKSARAGQLKTAHGSIQTPFFMPVATKGAVKHLDFAAVKEFGYETILMNTYHLMLRPGADLVKKLGGLHKLTGWQGAILTDSGGFQVFSLARDRLKTGESLVKMTDEGVIFKSHLDGSKHKLTPEKSLDIQLKLGVDMAVCLDQCLALPATKQATKQAVDITTAWAKRSKAHWQKQKTKALLFAVIQGGLDKKERLRSLGELTDIGFDGYNIGGLSVGETAKEMYKVLDWLAPKMPSDKPCYLMGVGYPENIVEAVARGVDMFDCVIPSREGRHGRLFELKETAAEEIKRALTGKPVRKSRLYEVRNINNARYKTDQGTIEGVPEGLAPTYAYLHHLFKVKEPLGERLATLNNLNAYSSLMRLIRSQIKNPQ